MVIAEDEQQLVIYFGQAWFLDIRIPLFLATRQAFWDPILSSSKHEREEGELKASIESLSCWNTST